MGERSAIVLAAGKSTRMLSDRPKVLHELCGRPMLSFVLGACRLAGVDRLAVVVGHGKEQVVERFDGQDDITWVEQTEQRGTGHAVQCCREALGDSKGSVLIIAGDMPLVRREVLAGLLESREHSGVALSMATTMLDSPTGYGRIVRDENGAIESIVEEVDCTTQQREICEVNPSYYCFDGPKLFKALDAVKPSGAKEEYYLTDVIGILGQEGEKISAELRVPAEDATGINSRLDLAVVSRIMQDRIQLGLMSDGVTIVDPDNTWIEADAAVGRDTIIAPFTVIGAGASIGSDCRIGPFARVGPGEVVADGTSIESTFCGGAAGA